MKKTALHKDIYRTITGTLPRFLSIFFIVVLGVAFYSGIRVTQKDMHITADHQFDGSRLMDVKVMGTLGISEENLTALRKLKNVQSVEGGHSVDVIARKQGSDEEHAIKVMGKTDKLNQITIIDGKLPQASGECLVDEWYAQQESEVHQNIFQDPEEALALERERCQALLWCNHQNFPQISIQKFI